MDVRVIRTVLVMSRTDFVDDEIPPRFHANSYLMRREVVARYVCYPLRDDVRDQAAQRHANRSHATCRLRLWRGQNCGGGRKRHTARGYIAARKHLSYRAQNLAAGASRKRPRSIFKKILQHLRTEQVRSTEKLSVARSLATIASANSLGASGSPARSRATTGAGLGDAGRACSADSLALGGPVDGCDRAGA
jgi:hypothetical protein